MTQVSVAVQRLTAQPERKISFYNFSFVLSFVLNFCLEELGSARCRGADKRAESLRGLNQELPNCNSHQSGTLFLALFPNNALYIRHLRERSSFRVSQPPAPLGNGLLGRHGKEQSLAVTKLLGTFIFYQQIDRKYTKII
jgi:hypothetical protein